MRKMPSAHPIASISSPALQSDPNPVATPQPVTLLIQQIASVENLTHAWQKVKRNIRRSQRPFSKGLDEITITAFEAAWTEQMRTLARELLNGQYHPLPSRHVLLNKRDGGQRTIAVLAVRDRIAQRAVYQILEPQFDSTFQQCSYGCRPYVGAPHAIMAAERYIKQGNAWVVHADVADFFTYINHNILMSLIQKTVKERAVLHLIESWLQVGLLSHTDSRSRNTAQKSRPGQITEPTDPGDASAWWESGEDILEQAIEGEAQQPTRNLNPTSSSSIHPFSHGRNIYHEYPEYQDDQGYQEYQDPTYPEYPDQWSYAPHPEAYPEQNPLGQIRQTILL